MNFAIAYCRSLTSLPDLSKWDINNVKFMESILQNCSSLLYIPDISKWIEKNRKINISNIFQDCIFLSYLNDKINNNENY